MLKLRRKTPEFMSIYNLRNLKKKQKTCFKNPSCIDVILTNSPRNFQTSNFRNSINNFFFLGTIKHFKILQIVFRSTKLIKTNCKPSKMTVLKYTFQQSFKLHIYRWKLNKKRTNAHIFA